MKKARNNSKKLYKKVTDELVEELIDKLATTTNHPSEIKKKIKKALEKQIAEDRIEQPTKDEFELIKRGITMQNLDNHYLLTGAMDKDFSAFAVNCCEHLYKEYKCQAPSEKLLVHLIINAYYRILKSSLIFTHDKWGSSNQTKLLNAFGQEIDRGNRQLIAAMQLLRQMKQPPLKVNVKAETAYLAQNQQINAQPEDINQANDEIIDQQ